MSPSNVLFLMSGSIAAYKACSLISTLVQSGHHVRVACTPNTINFIGLSTLEGLSGHKVLTQTFEPGQMMDHIHWTRWADWVVLCPATANTINKLATGIADDLVTSMLLAWEHKKPLFIAPAMNQEMYQHPATQASLQKLSSWGAQLLLPESGNLACGETGLGRLMEPETILSRIEEFFLPAPARPQPRILITAGGTCEPLDGVRVLTNLSTGRTGAHLAEAFQRAGWNVTLLRAESAVSANIEQQVTFTKFEDLNRAIKDLLSHNEYSAVLHAAAVSDYSINSIKGSKNSFPLGEGKLDSSESELTLHLTKNFKIIERLKTYSKNPDIRIIAFKLTNSSKTDERFAAVTKLLDQPAVEAVVHNDLSEMTISGQRHFDRHPSCIYWKSQGSQSAPNILQISCQNKAELAAKLIQLLNPTDDIVGTPNVEQRDLEVSI